MPQRDWSDFFRFHLAPLKCHYLPSLVQMNKAPDLTSGVISVVHDHSSF